MDSSTRLAAAIALPALLALACSAEPLPDSVQQIGRARFGIVDRVTPPADSELSEAVTLPDHWARSRPGQSGIGWYRMTIDLPDAAEGSWGLFVRSSSSSFDVFVADLRLGPARAPGEPDLQNWNQPEYFEVPVPLLREAGREIDLRLWAREGSFRGLGVVEAGPPEQLRPRYRSARFWNVETQRFWIPLGGTLALFAAGLWAATGRSALYACFVWFACAWLVPTVIQSMARSPGSFWLGQWLVHVGIQQMAVAAVFLAHRIAGVERPRTERAILVGSVGAAAVLGFAGVFSTQLFDPLANLFHVFGFVASIYIPVLFVRERARFAHGERAALILFTLLLFGASAHDLAAQYLANTWHSVRLLQHTAPIILMLFFAVLVTRFLALYRRAERQNEELETRIHEKEAELEERYEQLDDLQREGVLAEERSRMVREMHDGMGGQLVSLLALVESGPAKPNVLAAALRESLDELRLVIHSLEPSGAAVGTLLALIREQLSPRVEHAGLRFEWQVDASGDDIEVGPDRALHLVRIVEEAITNVLKHANAGTVRVATRREMRGDEPGTAVRISDDGIGITRASADADATAAGGRGLANMQQRAAVLGGTLQITAAGEGTLVELWLPEIP